MFQGRTAASFGRYDAQVETHTHRILVVDDDPRLRELLQRYLTENGFEVKTAIDGKSLDRLIAREVFDLLVLDLMLPEEDGLSICRRLRASSDRVPIIMLTAKGDPVDRIVGLEMGADDYLPKPFNPRELLARIHAILRRRPHEVAGGPLAEGVPVLFGGLTLDLGTRRLSRGMTRIDITTGEFALLRALVSRPRVALSRDKLVELTRGREAGAFDRSIDVQVSRLRRLIEEDPARPRYIQTVWGVGYVFVPDEQL